MPCVPLPTSEFPELPAPLSLTPPAVPEPPPLPDLPNYCCKLPPVEIPLPPIEIPSEVLELLSDTGALGRLKDYIDQALTFINSYPIKCPLE